MISRIITLSKSAFLRFFLLGLALAFTQEPFNLPYCTFLVLPLVPLLVIRFLKTSKQHLLSGFTFGLGYFGLTFSWIINPFLVDPQKNIWLAPFAYFLFVSALSLFWAIAFYLSNYLMKDEQENSKKVFCLSILFALAELLRCYLFSGFPWAILSYGWLDTPVSVFVTWFGPYIFNSIIIIVGINLLYSSTPNNVFKIVFLITACFGLENNYLEKGPEETSENLTVRLVQPNIKQKDKWKKENELRHLEILIGLSNKSPKPDLVVWPETAVYWLPEENPEKLKAIAAQLGSPLLFGALRFNRDAKKLFNAIFLIDGKGEIQSIYDKTFLVPFGEYVPLGGLIRYFNIFGNSYRLIDGFSSGTGLELIKNSGFPAFLPLICYEALFSNEILGEVKEARWILNITNDAWFGNDGGPKQHLNIARMRALENNIILIRVSNNGISAKISQNGKIEKYIELNKRDFLDVKLGFNSKRENTFYTTIGKNISSYFHLILLLLPILYYSVLNRKKRGNLGG